MEKVKKMHETELYSAVWTYDTGATITQERIASYLKSARKDGYIIGELVDRVEGMVNKFSQVRIPRIGTLTV